MTGSLSAPDFHIQGALSLRPDGLSGAALGVAGGVLTDAHVGRAVHLDGWELRPGLIDLHGDGFERHLAPRRGAMKDLSVGLASLDAELAANGITTAYLAQFYSWEGGMRGPDFAARMLSALDAARARLVTDMRVQLRVESHLIDDYPEIEALIDQHDIPYVVLNDHVPHAALARGKRPPRLTGQALKSGRSPEAHLALLQDLHARSAEVPGTVTALAARLAARGILTGSHDDADAAARRDAQAQGLTISEFPESREAALEAAGQGAPIVLGAPNVVRGGSHQGKVSAADLVREGLCSALASDYHYPAPFQAAQQLAGDVGVPAAWALVSSGPASVLGLADRGQLLAGLRADLVGINPATGRIGLTVTGGRIAYADPQAAAALLAA
ncbi:alpha-D-ribose 1-methylphosphonate 5-triphosphate diphosphatase [Pseudooceanicola nitratireducens]|uniref:alpha-D-ribose 1-methylphosphonate 5-triphosphate diphosphatase n=1 Tax=Pseudooceanicola nitratireducens TaxID=517719 RepID=UPI001C940C9A|nr:alpha-D-ribose 1-methylphosphonate 5-triphosphate diphosphatase [Pseudooceanicola nitratireducens]MBY6158275.1 alpha-D-ribose 1-methylphosphonate 5-triphosphate diphosphatase [Pseudooceanicola nitratireducens]